MILEVVDAPEKDCIRFSKMEMGTLYEVCEGESYEGAIILRLPDNRAVDLRSPGRTWSQIENNSIKVRPLPKGTQVVLTQE